MVRFSVGVRLLIMAACAISCNPYTRKLIHFSNETRNLLNDTLYCVKPIVEMRKQLTASVYNTTFEDKLTTESMANEGLFFSLEKVIDKQLIKSIDPGVNFSRYVFDSVLVKINSNSPGKYSCKRSSMASIKGDKLITVPYLIWTRTVDAYEEQRCAYRHADLICTWTKAQVYILIIDKVKSEVIYSNYSQWQKAGLYSPSEETINEAFARCLKPLVKISKSK